MLLDNQESLTSDLLASLEKPEFCDIKIESSDGEIQVNKSILGIRSEYFTRMFSPNNNFVESSTGLVKLPYPKAVVKKVVIYLYSGKMDVEEMALGQLLDLMELLNMMNLSQELLRVKDHTRNKIYGGKFLYSECLKNLDKCSEMGMEDVGETLMAHLRINMRSLCQLEEVCVLSEIMIMKLLEGGDVGAVVKFLKPDLMNDDEEMEEEDTDYEVSDDDDEEEDQTIFRFKTFVTWLSANSMDDDKKGEVLGSFDFESFNIEELSSVVTISGLYSSDKIIARMEQLYTELERKAEMLKEELEWERNGGVRVG